MPANRHTQAVVVIHGIGEQRPMDTLRAFVEAVLNDPKQGGELYWSKPDSMSESFELRKLQNREQPRTHFYEYYWAYKVTGTRLKHVAAWLSTLLLRVPWKVPPGMRAIWVLTWAFLLALAVAFMSGIFDRVTSPLTLGGIIGSIILGIFQYFIITYLGDAARYFSPTPENIALRRAIRADGIKLIRTLHESGKYERIIVVGHSLGTVIAYDVLKHYWETCHDRYDLMAAQAAPWTKTVAKGPPGASSSKTDGATDGMKPSLLERILSDLTQVFHLLSLLIGDLTADAKDASKVSRYDKEQPELGEVEGHGEALETNPDPAALEAFREAQTRLWRELRSLGNPWLVTDFVTLGSPLAHAALFLALDRADLDKKQRQRELPTCPPVPEVDDDGQGRYAFRVWSAYPGPHGEKVKLRALHHAALYACTRWTNLYFPAALGLFGDLVGGPLRPCFGLGIKDIPLTVSRWDGLGCLTPLAHTLYWWKDPSAGKQPANPEQEERQPTGAQPGERPDGQGPTAPAGKDSAQGQQSLKELRDALDLQGERFFCAPAADSTEEIEPVVK